jgi:ABC-type protease/lipase transport system fused ATPase/permease subunit
MVWDALQICSCNDFLKMENITNELKWIHSKNIGMSGGQKARIALSRTVYRIMKNKPKFITLDEVDKAIQTELVINIMENIFKYTKLNNILVFVICHSTEVKNLDYWDQIILFRKGNIVKRI